MLAGVPVPADAVAFLVVGLLGGAHCLGMCGPLVGLYARQMPGDAERRLTAFHVRQHALFNLGRTAGYALVGAVLAAFGSALVGIGGLLVAGDVVRAVAGLLAGVVIVAAGLSALGLGRALPTPASVASATNRVASTLAGRVGSLADGPGIVALGGLHAALPCPIIYPAYLYAVAVADPVRAALLLGLLGLGTFPTLFAAGTLLGSIPTDRRRLLHRALGVAFLVLGTVSLSHGLHLLGVNVPHLHLPYESL